MSTVRSFAKSCLVLLLGRKARPRTIVRGLASGYQIYVSPTEHLGYLVGTFEPRLQKAITNYAATGDTVYDIGANIGYITLSLAKRVGRNGRVVAFEPIPQTFDLLRRNIEINKVNNVQLLNVAASTECGEAVIRMAGNLSMASIVWHRKDPSASELLIRTVAIDELVEAGEFGAPKFVKVDVEGAEGLVLQGMARTIAAAKPVIYLECSDIGRETTWRLLRDLGYGCQAASTWKWVDALDEYRDFDFLWLPPGLAAK